jgi:Protein of unknown function (DUF3149)
VDRRWQKLLYLPVPATLPESSMDPLLHELFSDPVGIMSLITIGGVLVIGLVLAVIIRRKMNEEGR